MTITLVIGADDWRGLYIDGNLIEQNHYIYAREVLHAIGGQISIDPIICVIREFDMEKHNMGKLPDTLKELDEIENG